MSSVSSLVFDYWITSSASNVPNIDVFDTYVVYGNAMLQITDYAFDVVNSTYNRTITATIVDGPDYGETYVKIGRFSGQLYDSHTSLSFDGLNTYLVVDNYFIFTFNEILMWVAIIVVGVALIGMSLWAYTKYFSDDKKSTYEEITDEVKIRH